MVFIVIKKNESFCRKRTENQRYKTLYAQVSQNDFSDLTNIRYTVFNDRRFFRKIWRNYSHYFYPYPFFYQQSASHPSVLPVWKMQSVPESKNCMNCWVIHILPLTDKVQEMQKAVAWTPISSNSPGFRKCLVSQIYRLVSSRVPPERTRKRIPAPALPHSQGGTSLKTPTPISLKSINWTKWN